MEPIISIRHLDHYYGTNALKKQVLFDINLDIVPGEIVIMTGPSGSGKTTLLTLLGGLRSVQSGGLRCLDYELAGASESQLVAVRRHIGYIFQAHNLLPFMTAQQNVGMSLEMHQGISRRVAHIRSGEMLERVGLGERSNYYPDKLSGGQKQRVAIARALVSQPSLVLADEPTASLDKKTGRDVVDLMQQLVKQQGCTILLVTHDNRILDIADRIIHMEDGQLVSSTPQTSSGHVLSQHISPANADYTTPRPVSTLAEEAFSIFQDTDVCDSPPVVEEHSPAILDDTNLSSNSASRPIAKYSQGEFPQPTSLVSPHTESPHTARPHTARTSYTENIVDARLDNFEGQQRADALQDTDHGIEAPPDESTELIDFAAYSPQSLEAVGFTEPNLADYVTDGAPSSSALVLSTPGSIELSPKAYKVVCIDTDVECLNAVETLLDQGHFQTIAINNPVSALATVLEHQPELILVDVKLPGLNGYRLCKLLRQNPLLKQTPIIITTWQKRNIIGRLRARMSGASGYLVKPLNQLDFMTTIFPYMS